MTPNPFVVIPFNQGIPVALSVEALVQRVIEGDAAAWKELWRTVEPRLFAMLRRPRFIGRLSQSEDDCRNIVVEVLGALQADDHARLRRYAETRAKNPSLPFFAWLIVVAKRLAIDYMRRQDGYHDLRGRGGDGPKGEWATSATLPNDSQLDGGRPPFTDRAEVRRVLEIAETLLGPEQRSAVASWSAGRDFDDIGGELGVSGKQAERLVRAGLERLRRNLRGGGAS